MLDFATYQKQAMTTAVYPGRGTGNYTYPALGLAGRPARSARKLKIIRDEGGVVSEERRALLAKIGRRVVVCRDAGNGVGLGFTAVAADNLAKLALRKENGKIHGSGDLR